MSIHIEFPDWFVAFMAAGFAATVCLPLGVWGAKKAVWRAVEEAVKTKWGERSVIAFIRKKAARAQKKEAPDAWE